jgi:very-short-patch-repair endonuclease
MAPRFVPYRRNLKTRAQAMRRDSPQPERRLWYELLSGLPQRFSRQKPLGPYVADFYCSAHRLVIEIDGDSHFTEKGGSYDAARTKCLKSRGIRVLRFTNEEVMREFEAVSLAIQEALRASR